MSCNETTIINGKQIALTPKEKKMVDEFHKSRIAFAFLDDGRCAINVKDVREHKIYLQEDFGISFDEFENLTRGYIKPGRIIFYKTPEVGIRLGFLCQYSVVILIPKLMKKNFFNFLGILTFYFISFYSIIHNYARLF